MRLSGLREELTRVVVSFGELSFAELSLADLSLPEPSFEELSEEDPLSPLSFEDESDFGLSSFFESFPLSEDGAWDLLA